MIPLLCQKMKGLKVRKKRFLKKQITTEKQATKTRDDVNYINQTITSHHHSLSDTTLPPFLPDHPENQGTMLTTLTKPPPLTPNS